MIHKIPAELKAMPRNGGTTLRMRRYNPLATAPVPLGNSGITPAPQNLSSLNIDAQMSFYGTYVLLNEQVTLQNQDPVLNEAAQRLGVSLKQSEDQLVRDMLAASASFINCVNGSDGDFPTEISRSDVDIVVRALVGQNAHTVAENIEGDDMFGTGPIRDAYFMYGHTDLIPDIERVTG